MGLNKFETIKLDGKKYMGLKVAKDYLTGKRVLIVDDEEDVLDSLEDLLTMCRVMKASSFEEAKNLLMNEKFHLAILDIKYFNDCPKMTDKNALYSKKLFFSLLLLKF